MRHADRAPGKQDRDRRQTLRTSTRSKDRSVTPSRRCGAPSPSYARSTTSRPACWHSASCWAPIRARTRPAPDRELSPDRGGPRRSPPGSGSAARAWPGCWRRGSWPSRADAQRPRRSRRSPCRAAIRRSTSSSRADSWSIGSELGSPVDARMRACAPRTTSAARGESHATPWAAARTATTTSSIGVSLARKPHAPASSAAATSASSETTVKYEDARRLGCVRGSRASPPDPRGPASGRPSGPRRAGARRQAARPSDRPTPARRPRCRAGRASSDASPVRNRSWSSTTSTRIAAVLDCASLIVHHDRSHLCAVLGQPPIRRACSPR